MRGDPDDAEPAIGDAEEILELGWFAVDALPQPRALYFENLLAGKCSPAKPQNLPFAPTPQTSNR